MKCLYYLIKLLCYLNFQFVICKNNIYIEKKSSKSEMLQITTAEQLQHIIKTYYFYNHGVKVLTQSPSKGRGWCRVLMEKYFNGLISSIVSTLFSLEREWLCSVLLYCKFNIQIYVYLKTGVNFQYYFVQLLRDF